MTLTLGLQNDGVMTWWVDASYAVQHEGSYWWNYVPGTWVNI